MLKRLADLFEGPAGLEPWAPPETPAALNALLPWRAFDEAGELYVNAASVGFVLEVPPFVGIDAETLGALSGTLADAAPERCASSTRTRSLSISALLPAPGAWGYKERARRRGSDRRRAQVGV